MHDKFHTMWSVDKIMCIRMMEEKRISKARVKHRVIFLRRPTLKSYPAISLVHPYTALYQLMAVITCSYKPWMILIDVPMKTCIRELLLSIRDLSPFTQARPRFHEFHAIHINIPNHTDS